MQTSTRVRFLAIGFFALTAMRASALAGGDDPGPLSVTVAGPDSTGDAGKSPQVHHLFGGQTVELVLSIRGRSETRLDVRARLVQRAFSLGAPLGNPVEVLSGRAFTGDAPVSARVSLPLPEVRTDTDFDLEFEVGTAGERWRDAGRASLRLYPRTILAALSPLSERVALRLKESDGALRLLLESLEVRVVDHRAPVLPPGKPILTLVVNHGDVLDTSDLEILEGETVVVFCERVRTLPKVVKSPCRGGHLIQVELEVLRNLDRDPRVQRTFMDIIELAYPGQEKGEEK